MASPIILSAGPAPRGGGSQQVATYGNIQSMDLSWSWGARAASAIIVYASDASIEENAAVLLTIPITNDAVTGAPVAPGSFARFYGICKKEVATDSSAGQINTLEFVDMRELLSWDLVFGYFNKRQDLLVDGIWSKRYAHLLPVNQGINLVTYTPGPYTAAEILDFIFVAPTVYSPWVREYHTVQQSDYIYDIDCSTGRKISDVVTEISDKQGLTFTLLGGQWNLYWVQKGVGSVPANYDQFPENSDDRRLGTALSGKPDTVTIFGGRNRYQCLDIPMAPDWNQVLISPTSLVGADYVAFESQFTDYVYNNMSDPISGNLYNVAPDTDPENVTGYMLAKARAETITLGELADFIDSKGEGDGEAYRDHRKFNGRTRLDIPVIAYVKLLVYRAFSLPAGFALTTAGGQTLGALSCKIVPTTLVETTYDFVTGKMDYIPETAPGSNGLAIVQGFNFFTPPPLAFRSDQFNLAAWLNTQQLWQKVNFQIDDTGDQTQFIILDDPVAVSPNLMTTIDGHGVLNAAATFTVPAVMASLVFECERFQYYQWEEGTPGRIGVTGTNLGTGINGLENVADLNADYVTSYGNTSSPDEQPFADGQLATEKANAIADYILEQEPVYVLGGYVNRGCNGTQLTGTVDRVRTFLDPEKGLLEQVDFTTERTGNTFEPERDFERKIQLLQLAPGQLDMRNDARAIWSTVAALRNNPRFIQQLVQAFNDRLGSGAPLTQVLVDIGE